MRRGCLIAIVLLGATPARAQNDGLFGSGKPPVFREEAMDRKFKRTKLAKLLKSGTSDRACVELLGGLLTALAEVGPWLHKRDENFSLHPALIAAVDTQLSTPRFPAMAYLVSMVRRVQIDRRLPDEWLATAEALNAQVKIIDLAKLRALNEQFQPIEAFQFTIPELRVRYLREALGANSAVTTDALLAFRDTYLDRDIAWGGAVLVDVGVNQPKGKKRRRFTSAEPEELVAILRWMPPDPKKSTLDLSGEPPAQVDPVTLYVRLQPRQYADLETLHRNQRILVKGRLWEMNKTMTEIEIRDGLLFNDPDWTQGVILGSPSGVAACPAALNDLTGLAPAQPGGFRH